MWVSIVNGHSRFIPFWPSKTLLGLPLLYRIIALRFFVFFIYPPADGKKLKSLSSPYFHTYEKNVLCVNLPPMYVCTAVTFHRRFLTRTYFGINEALSAAISQKLSLPATTTPALIR